MNLGYHGLLKNYVCCLRKIKVRDELVTPKIDPGVSLPFELVTPKIDPGVSLPCRLALSGVIYRVTCCNPALT